MFSDLKKYFLICFLLFFSLNSLGKKAPYLSEEVWQAIIEDNVPKLKELRKEGSDFHNTESHLGESLAHFAISLKKYNSLRYFIEELDFNVNLENHFGQTLLVESVIAEDEASMKYLLSKGADPYPKRLSQKSAMYWAIFKENINLIKILLKHGVVFQINKNKKESSIFYYKMRNNPFFFKELNLILERDLQEKTWLQAKKELSIFKKSFSRMMRR